MQLRHHQLIAPPGVPGRLIGQLSSAPSPVATEVGAPALLAAAARATSLDERLMGALPPAATDPGVIEARLGRWCHHVADGDQRRFRSYLAESGVSSVDAVRVVADVVGPVADDAPPWLHTLADVVRLAVDGSGAGSAEAVAFGHLWTAAGGTARQALLSRLTAEQRALIGAAALDGIVDDLLGELASLGAPVVYEGFARLRRRLRAEGMVHESYQRFVEEERRAGLPSLVVEFPVLGRLVAQRVDEVVDATATLVTRLHTDLPALRDHFRPGRELGNVSSIAFGWSDRHRGGRTVARVGFEGGLVLAYKPKPLGAERAMRHIVRAVAARELPAPVVPDVVACDDYGWAGWIHQQPCGGRSDATNYFRAAGTLLAVTSALAGTDLLYANIVAAGSAPAVVDAEMMAPPRLSAPRLASAEPPIPADAAVLADLQDSVVDTGLLPWSVGATANDARDISGLTGRRTAWGTSWLHRNTADMIPVTEPRVARRANNALMRDGVVVDPADHVGGLIDGYRAAHAWLAADASSTVELMAASGLFDAASRFTFRATGTYELFASRAATPERFRDGLERSFALDAVNNRAWWSTKLSRMHAVDPVGARRVTAAERAALERGDIPLFLARPTDVDLHTERGTVRGVFRGSPVDAATTRLGIVDDAHLERQLLAIRGCFEARHGASAGHRRRAVARRRSSGGDLMHGASRIAEVVGARAVHAHASVSWLVVGENHATRRRQVMPIGPDLYGGRAGLGVFLAAYAACSGRGSDAELARACLRPLVDLAAGVADEVGGALTGMASAIYGLTLAAELLGDDHLFDGARQASAVVAAHATTVTSSADPGDVASGLIGAALALAAATTHGAGPRAAEAAGDLGRRALDAEQLDAAADGDDLPVGLAHGLLGRALAYDRLHVVTGDLRFSAAADVAVQRADLALNAGPAVVDHLVDSWCRGRVGVAAAAAVLGHRCATPTWRERIDAVVDTARSTVDTSDGSVCCGLGGAVDALLLAGAEPDARDLASAIAAAADDDWLLDCEPRVAPLLVGFHRGLAGIGYAMLRAADPARFPSVLTWS